MSELEGLDLDHVEHEVTVIEQDARAYRIQCAAEQEAASLFLRDTVTPRLRAIRELFAPLKQNAHRAWRSICDAEAVVTGRLVAIDQRLRAEMTRWQAAEEQRLADLRRKAQAEADAAAAAARLAEVDALAEAGDTEAATRLLAQELPPTLPLPTSPAAPKVKGVVTATRWTIRVMDKCALIRWVAEDPEQRHQFLDVNEGMLRKLAGAMRRMFKVPGVIAEEVQDVRVTAARSNR